MRLSIVIPALNEEQAIGSTARACLESAPELARAAGIDDVEVIVVDDGSTDRTAEVVRSIPGVRMVQHDVNRGYGAAITTGFAHATGELLSFLDADGTCDPLLFGPLARELLAKGADIASGSRLGPGSAMPRVRRLGNRFFAFFVNSMGEQKLEDVASGMRVIRRSALAKLAPLPSGLHYTPAMSAKAVFDAELKIVELPIPYAARVGESKLSVLKDGRRFFQVLVETALSYRPFRFFGLVGLVFFLVAAAYSVAPVRVLLAPDESLRPDAIYRIFTIVVLFLAGVAFIDTGLLAERATAILHARRGRPHLLHRAFDLVLMRRPFLVAAVLLLLAVATAWRSLVSYVRLGRIEEHWIHVVGGGVLGLLAVLQISFGFMKRVLELLAQRHHARVEAERAEAAPRPDAD